MSGEVYMQRQIWGTGPNSWASDYAPPNENGQSLRAIKAEAVLGDLEDGPPHPETMAALAVMAQLGKSVPQVVVMEHAERAMDFCRVGLLSIPKKHRGQTK